METKQALLIFQKNAVPGYVKTRLAATIGDARAMDVYLFLVAHTHRVAQQVQVNKHLFYSDRIEPLSGNPENYTLHVQHGNDLGMRMQQAFATVFEAGAQQAVIIGTDCYELDAATIQDAFQLLAENEVVIGPAEDGGYYLLGLKKNSPGLFNGITWSSDAVFTQTMEKAKVLGLRVATLPVLPDIDTEADLKSLREHFLDS